MAERFYTGPTCAQMHEVLAPIVGPHKSLTAQADSDYRRQLLVELDCATELLRRVIDEDGGPPADPDPAELTLGEIDTITAVEAGEMRRSHPEARRVFAKRDRLTPVAHWYADLGYELAARLLSALDRDTLPGDRALEGIVDSLERYVDTGAAVHHERPKDAPSEEDQ